MKKLIALSLIVVCLGCFSLGCGKPAPAPAPAPPVDDVAVVDVDAPETPAEAPVLE